MILTYEEIRKAAEFAAEQMWPESGYVGWTEDDAVFHRKFIEACLEKLREEGLHQNVLPLLDVLDQPENAAFIKLALSKTDLRVKEGKKISVGFLFSALLWQNVQGRERVRPG